MNDTNNVITMPDAIGGFCQAHKSLCDHFKNTGLAFTLDGKLVGDLAEALVAEAFGLELCRFRTCGVDARVPKPDGRSVQIKATGIPGKGPAFSFGKAGADHLIFVYIDFPGGKAEVIYNGPEAPIRKLLPETWTGTKRVLFSKVVEENERVPDECRLKRIH